MERRNFIGGLFGGIAASGALLINPSKETAKSGVMDLLKPNAPLIVSPHSATPQIDEGYFVFDALGNPLGIIIDIRQTREIMDVTSYIDTEKQYISGMPRCEMRVLVQGQFSITDNLKRKMTWKA